MKKGCLLAGQQKLSKSVAPKNSEHSQSVKQSVRWWWFGAVVLVVVVHRRIGRQMCDRACTGSDEDWTELNWGDFCHWSSSTHAKSERPTTARQRQQQLANRQTTSAKSWQGRQAKEVNGKLGVIEKEKEKENERGRVVASRSCRCECCCWSVTRSVTFVHHTCACHCQ